MANMYGISDSVFGDSGFYKSSPVGNFNFVLTVEGIYDIPLKSVRAFQKVNQFEKIKEGGVNDYVHLKRAPIQDAHTIQFERYISGTLVDPLANGAELSIPVILWLKRAANNAYTEARKNGKELNDEDDTSSVRLYIFTGCVVMSKEYGALDAEHSGLATEVVTMAYKELYIVPNLYTFFGGGTNISSAGVGGELDNTDESAREEFRKKQEAAHKAAEEDNKGKKADAEKKEKEAREKFEKQQKDAHDAAQKANEEALKKATEKEKTERAEQEKKQKAEHDAAEKINEKAKEEAEKKEKKAKKEAEEYRKKSQEEAERKKKEEEEKKKKK